MKEEERGFSWGEGAVGGRESNATHPFLYPIGPALLVSSADGVKGRVRKWSSQSPGWWTQRWRKCRCSPLPGTSSHGEAEKFSHWHEIRQVHCSWKDLLREEVTALFLKKHVHVNHCPGVGKGAQATVITSLACQCDQIWTYRLARGSGTLESDKLLVTHFPSVFHNTLWGETRQHVYCVIHQRERETPERGRV